MNWLILATVGILVGAITGRLMGNSEHGLFGDLLLGLFGLVGGGVVFTLFEVTVYGLFGQLVVGIAGACILIWLYHAIIVR